MKNSFSQMKKNVLTRKFGGTTYGVADPYVTGYHFVYFQKLPDLKPFLENEVSGSLSASDVQTILSASCLGVTPPGGTLNKVEFTGLGGTKWAVPGNIDYGNSVTVKFLEFNRLPIMSIMHSWIKLIRDYRLGITEALEDTEDGSGYSKKTYSALMYYWTTAPDARTVEYYACYDGVFPTKDPQDLFSSDVETVGRLDVEIEFNVDYAWHEKWVYDNCKTFAAAMYAQGANTTGIQY